MKKVLAVLLLAAIGLLFAFHRWRTGNIGAVQRGFDVASRRGCFTCHGLGGQRGAPNPGHGLGDVPSFTGGLLRMVAYVKAVSDFERPDDPKAEEGRQIVQRMGCFNCHGPQGRGSALNVRAFKGYIPSWDGADFAELVRNDGEIRGWILDGGTRRAYANPAARWFLERQPIKMPAYRGRLTEDEVARIIDYMHWLRAHPY